MIKILTRVFLEPFFWVGIYLVGYMITIITLGQKEMLAKVEKRMPKILLRIFLLTIFIGTPIALSVLEGPKIAIPKPIALSGGIALLGINFLIKALAQKQLGVIPALKSKGKLATGGIYGVVRHPMYLSNGLLAVGVAFLFRSRNALLFSIPYFLLFLPIIYFEERDLLEKYGKDYEGYKRKVPWRMIPKLF